MKGFISISDSVGAFPIDITTIEKVVNGVIFIKNGGYILTHQTDEQINQLIKQAQ